MSSILPIQVNTDELRSNAGTLEGIGSEVSGINGELNSSVNGISSRSPGEYRGQLEASVGSLLAQAANGSASIQAELEKLSYELNARAAAFDKADVPSGKTLSGMFGANGVLSKSPLLALFAGLVGLRIGDADFVFSITGLWEKIRDRIGITGIGGSNEVESRRDETENNNRLSNADPSGESCATYARKRRNDLGRNDLGHTSEHHDPDSGYDKEAAANYKNIPGSFELSNQDNISDLTKVIHEGDAIVWDKGAISSDYPEGHRYGHVAIVEKVYPDRVVVSHANWSGGNEFSTAQISRKGLFIVP